MARRLGAIQIVFLSLVGLMGWTAVLAMTLDPPVALRPWDLSWPLGATFLLSACARFLAFKAFRRVRIALDSPFYVASAFVFGIVPAAWLVSLVLTADSIVRSVRRRGSWARNGGGSPQLIIAGTIYSGGLPALMLLVAGLLLDIDGLYPRTGVKLAYMLPLFAIAFIVAHYVFAGSSHWFDGAPPRDLWRRFFLRVVPAELSLTPIALSMVWGYIYQGFAPFFLLGTSALLFNWVFRRERILRDKLRERVSELWTLNKIGQIIAGSLEHDVLVRNIASEALRLVGHASHFTIGSLDKEEHTVDYEVFDETGELQRSFTDKADGSLCGWVMANRKPLLLGDVQRDYHRYAIGEENVDPSCNSWLGVPLVTYDEVVGVMSVQTEQSGAYNEDQLRVLTTVADQAAVALENSRLFELATVDGLTRLLVRRHFDQRLQEEWCRAVRYRSQFALGIFDLDNFKQLNDTYGHQAGDQVLRAAAAALRGNMRTADLAGRYGGEEFAFLLPRTSLHEAFIMAERIRQDIERLAVTASGNVLAIRASIGVAAFPECGAKNAEQLVAQADRALYKAKRDGKNRVVAASGPADSLTPAAIGE